MGSKIFKAVKQNDITYVFKLDLDSYLSFGKSYWNCINGKRGFKYLRTSKGLYHRVVIGAKKGEIVDHKNRNTFDNTLENLRICTYSQNSINRFRENNTRGISIIPQTGKWRARVQFNKKIYNCGVYENKEDAILAYNKLATKLHREFAILNKI